MAFPTTKFFLAGLESWPHISDIDGFPCEDKFWISNCSKVSLQWAFCNCTVLLETPVTCKLHCLLLWILAPRVGDPIVSSCSNRVKSMSNQVSQPGSECHSLWVLQLCYPQLVGQISHLCGIFSGIPFSFSCGCLTVLFIMKENHRSDTGMCSVSLGAPAGHMDLCAVAFTSFGQILLCSPKLDEFLLCWLFVLRACLGPRRVPWFLAVKWRAKKLWTTDLAANL